MTIFRQSFRRNDAEEKTPLLDRCSDAKVVSKMKTVII